MPEPGVANLLTLEVETAGDVAVIKCLGKRIRELLSLTNLLSVFAIVGEHGTTIRM